MDIYDLTASHSGTNARTHTLTQTHAHKHYHSKIHVPHRYTHEYTEDTMNNVHEQRLSAMFFLFLLLAGRRAFSASCGYVLVKVVLW